MWEVEGSDTGEAFGDLLKGKWQRTPSGGGDGRIKEIQSGMPKLIAAEFRFAELGRAEHLPLGGHETLLIDEGNERDALPLTLSSGHVHFELLAKRKQVRKSK